MHFFNQRLKKNIQKRYIIIKAFFFISENDKNEESVDIKVLKLWRELVLELDLLKIETLGKC